MTPPRIPLDRDVRVHPRLMMSFRLLAGRGLVTNVLDGRVHYEWHIGEHRERRRMRIEDWRRMMYDEAQDYTSELDDHDAAADCYEVDDDEVLLVLWGEDGAGKGYRVRAAEWCDVTADDLRAMGVEP